MPLTGVKIRPILAGVCVSVFMGGGGLFQSAGAAEQPDRVFVLKDNVMEVRSFASKVVKPDVAYIPFDLVFAAADVLDIFKTKDKQIKDMTEELKKTGVPADALVIHTPTVFANQDDYNKGNTSGVSVAGYITLKNITKWDEHAVWEKISSITKILQRYGSVPNYSSPGYQAITSDLMRNTSNSGGTFNSSRLGAVFGFKNYEAVENELLKEAIEKARVKIGERAKTIGMRVRGMTSFFVSTGSDAWMDSANSVLPAEPMSVKSGELRLLTGVSLSFAIE